ncbi:MAG: glycoside hydrolase family 28 protein [Bryobacteraceae bacterium]
MSPSITRRILLKDALALAAACGVRGFALNASAAETRSPATSMPRVQPPAFPHRTFDIAKFGAVGDGRTKCTAAIRKAIAACSAAGGGRVVVPKGSFLTGAIHLESNVDLHVTKGATLLFSRDPNDYLPVVFTRYEGVECMNYSPFIYAFEKQNIAVTGPGLLDGQADREHWWPWAGKSRDGWKPGQPNLRRDRKKLFDMGEHDVPVKNRVFGKGHYLRPNFVQPYRCTNVLLEGFRVKASPMWELNPVLCRNVMVRGVQIDSHGPNNDGCDPEASRDVLISDCTFSTGDDCIAVKSGRNRDGRRVGVPCENVLIQGCNMKDGHGGVSIGSEVSGGIKNIVVERCHMSSPNLQRGLRIKTNSYRGGDIENIAFSHVTIGQVAEAAIEVDFFYEEGAGGPFRPAVKNIVVSDVACGKSKYAIFLRGYANDPISGVTISHCTFHDAAKGAFFEHVESVKIEHTAMNGKTLKFHQNS